MRSIVGMALAIAIALCHGCCLSRNREEPRDAAAVDSPVLRDAGAALERADVGTVLTFL